jgi:trk system potassium uptake protein TrkH
VAILAGTGLLLLPFSTRSGSISFIDALFTSTSAICVTGLIVQDTATFFTPFGQVVILTLIQLGGLGIMTFSTLILMVAGRRISIKDKIMIQEGYHPGSPKDFPSLIRSIFLYAMVIELAGAAFLFWRFQKDFEWGRALGISVFHSISAFCNAGFSLFSNNLMSYRSDIVVNVTVILLIIFGGLGFLVIQDVSHFLGGVIRRKKRTLSLHARLVVAVTAFLIIVSFILFIFMEARHSLDGFSTKDKLLASLFQVVTPRTAGFNTIDLTTMTSAAAFLIILLMFIGASPGSTGGGVKTSTVGVIFFFLRSRIVAQESVNIFSRKLPYDTVVKAFTLVSLAFCLVYSATFLISLAQPEFILKEVLFEVVSAFGTVGLSLGITFKLTSLSKYILVLTMYAGRVGPLTLLYAFSRQKAPGRFEYVEENVMIG